MPDCSCGTLWTGQSYTPYCPDPDKILHGPAIVYIKAWDDDGTVFTCLGITQGGLTITRPMEHRSVDYDQGTTPLRDWIFKRDTEVEFSLLENTLGVLYYALNADTYSADVSTGAITAICTTGQILERYWRMEIRVPFVSEGVQWQRGILLPKVALIESGPFTFKKDEESPIPVKFRVVGDFDMSGFECCGVTEQWLDIAVI